MRLFAGIALDEGTRIACTHVSARLEATGFAARYEGSEKLHVTLAFLGRVDASQLNDIQAMLDGVAAESTRFSLQLDKLGAFPNERRPRIIYIGSREQGAEFRHLSAAVRAGYEARGFTFNDAFVAHVTIARVKGGSTAPLPMIEVTPIDFKVEALTLFESLPGNGTTRYELAHTSAMKW
jgi:RNA 2',3'-cyclic 3'-phosphodiesterase